MTNHWHMFECCVIFCIGLVIGMIHKSKPVSNPPQVEIADKLKVEYARGLVEGIKLCRSLCNE